MTTTTEKQWATALTQGEYEYLIAHIYQGNDESWTLRNKFRIAYHEALRQGWFEREEGSKR